MQTRKHWKMIVAVSAWSAAMMIASSATAQQRIDTSGRALDANNRIGSGGYNSGRDMTAPNLNNAIVTGNVTGGAEFRGTVPYTDPRAFRGTLAGAGVDRFVRGSAGVATVDGFNNAQSRQLYYGESRGVAAPPGFAPIGATGGYVPAPTPTRIGSDLRLGSVFDTPTVLLPRPGELLLGGQVDASNNNILISASPLYGIRPLSSGDERDAGFVRRYTNAFRDAGQTRAADDPMIRRMRDELREDGAARTEGGLGEPMISGIETRPLTADPLGTDVASGQEVRNQMLLSPAVKQSPQYRQLVERLERFNEAKRIDPSIAAAQEFNVQRRAAEAAQEATDGMFRPPTTPGPGDAPAPELPTVPGAPTIPGLTPDAARPGMPGAPDAGPGALLGPSRLADKPKPPMITSLATGVQAKGLEQLLREAETLMRDSKFVQAIDKYGTAQQVAPNNPLPLLGLANAELGASFYARADTHLRQAFDTAPALMMAQYDLRQFLGEERLAFVVKDLKEIANTEKASPRPLLLLAYIAYNEGNDRMAAGYLDLAEKRTAGKDPFYQKLRDHWQLPPVSGDDTDLNK